MSSAQNQSYARPYAEAAFQYAKQHNAVLLWDHFFVLFSKVFADPALQDLLRNPSISQTELVTVIASAELDKHQMNFLLLLAKNRRLIYFAVIADQFNALRDQDENILRVTVSSPFALDESTQTQLKQKLTEQFKKQIIMETKIAPELIGGLKIQIGDRVLDSSLQDRLSQLSQNLSRSDRFRTTLNQG